MFLATDKDDFIVRAKLSLANKSSLFYADYVIGNDDRDEWDDIQLAMLAIGYLEDIVISESLEEERLISLISGILDVYPTPPITDQSIPASLTGLDGGRRGDSVIHTADGGRRGDSVSKTWDGGRR